MTEIQFFKKEKKALVLCYLRLSCLYFLMFNNNLSNECLSDISLRIFNLTRQTFIAFNYLMNLKVFAPFSMSSVMVPVFSIFDWQDNSFFFGFLVWFVKRYEGWKFCRLLSCSLKVHTINIFNIVQVNLWNGL